MIATVLTHFGSFTGAVRRLKAAQLAVYRTLGDSYLLEEIDHEESMQGRYKITGPEMEEGEHINKDGKMKRHTVVIDKE